MNKVRGNALNKKDYQIISKTIQNSVFGDYLTYGIQCGEIAIEDISTKKDFVEELIQQFREHDLSPLHLQDAVLDAIS